MQNFLKSKCWVEGVNPVKTGFLCIIRGYRDGECRKEMVVF